MIYQPNEGDLHQPRTGYRKRPGVRQPENRLLSTEPIIFTALNDTHIDLYFGGEK